MVVVSMSVPRMVSMAVVLIVVAALGARVPGMCVMAAVLIVEGMADVGVPLLIPGAAGIVVVPIMVSFWAMVS